MKVIDTSNLVHNLQKAYNKFMSVISDIEERNDLDPETKKQAKAIIEQAQIHGEIALETISG